MPSKKNKREQAASRAANKSQTEQAEVKVEEAVKKTVKSESGENKKSSTSSPKTTALSFAALRPSTPLKSLTVNKKLKIITNSYPVTVTNQKIYRYDVKVEKFLSGNCIVMTDGKASSLLRQLVSTALCERLPSFLYDGAKILYSLEQMNSFYKDLNLSMIPEGIRTAYFSKETKSKLDCFIRVCLTKNEASWENRMEDVLLEDMVQGTKVITNVLHLLLAQQARDSNFLVTKQQFFERPTKPVKQGKQEREGIGAGFKVAVGNDLQLVLDYKQGFFFPEVPLSQLAVDYTNPVKMRKFLTGLRVRTDYNNQYFRIDGISQKPIGEMKIGEDSLLSCTAKICKKAEDKFDPKKFGVQKKVMKKNEPGKFEYFTFPIENLVVCADQKMGLAQCDPPSAMKPRERFSSVSRMGKSSNILEPNKLFAKFGVKINPNPIHVEAATIPIPQILYAGGVMRQPDLNNRASWSTPKKVNNIGGLVDPKNLERILILFNTRADNKMPQNVVEERISELKANIVNNVFGLGLSFSRIDIEDLGRTYPNCLAEKAIVAKMESLKDQKNLIVFFADHSEAPTHKILKLMERMSGIVTAHVALDKSLKKQGNVTIGNLLMKINSKMGGLNFKVQPEHLIRDFWGPDSKTLIISYDVCHSSGKHQYKEGEICEEPAVVGFGHNAGPNKEIVLGDFHYQTPRSEEVESEVLTFRIKKIMMSWLQYNRLKAPKNILILRDGVSEGQYSMVMQREFAAIQSAVNDVMTSNKINTPVKYAVMVATKRHSNRLALVGDNGDLTNVTPLTAVDRTITRKNASEIIFVTHCPLSGTAQPILLNVLHNEKVFESHEQITQLMAALCCVHQASTGIISLPETIYAADEYAKRGADLFEAYKQRMADSNEKLPTVIIGDAESYNWLRITGALCYDSSQTFKNKRIA